jgi:CheY-like chemotaxis protein
MLIAALTGWGHDEHQARAREAGFDRHLVKPAEPAQVLALLADASHARVRTPVDLLERTPGRGRRAH